VKKAWVSRLANPLILAGLTLALALLAGLQYRWIGELSEAEKARLERSLERSARRFRAHFNRRLEQLAAGLAPDMSGLSSETYLQATASRLAASAGGTDLRVARAWMRRYEPGEGSEMYLWTPGAGNWEAVQETDPGAPQALVQPFRGFGRRGFGGRSTGWSFLAEGPYLALPLVHLSREGPRVRPDLLALMFVELDAEAIRDGLFPALFAEAFGEIDELRYQAVVVEQAQPPRIVYSSDAEARVADFSRADVHLPLLWSRDELQARGGPERPRGPGPRPGTGGPGFGPGLPPGGPNEPDRAAPGEANVSPGPGPDWVFLARHRSGSLDAVVGRLRRRNLVISGGIMALLICGMAAVLVSTRRAQRLAEMQMEFVAGVSHNLRTPLAVIRSAGDNLAEGVVAADDQVREYGRLIRSEGRRLSGMVEQTLQFAAVQAGKRQYRIEAIATADLVRRAVDEIMPTIEEAGFSLELDLPDNLPAVDVDVSAASHALQNLIGNAVKYGGDARWVGVSARQSGGDVEVTVRDRGPGVDPQELPRIFEPFFRGRRASEQQIKGSGLGLALARSDAEGFGGKLTVESAEGRGAAFTLLLPGAKDDPRT